MPSAPVPTRAAPAARKKAAKVKTTCKWVTKKVKSGGRVRKKKVKVCTPVKAPRKPAATAPRKPAATAPRKPVAAAPVNAPQAPGLAPAPAARPPATIGQVAPAAPVTAPPAPPAPAEAPVPVFASPLVEAHLDRLLWRAGFGPDPALKARLAGKDLQTAVLALTRPAGAAKLTGPPAVDDAGRALAPADAWGHDHLDWLDRMVRSDQPLVERMALVWHDWFATSNAGVNSQQLMLDQVQLFRTKGLGSFDELLTAVTSDPAMLLWLNGSGSTKWNPNENYARELMELFTLGAERGAYIEQDVRELARALTGFRNDWSAELGSHNFRYDASWHDTGSKTVFGQSGAFGWTDAVRLCVTHPLHASFFCTKLWSAFVPTAPDATTLATLQGLYVSSGRQIRPVVEAILQHPAFHDGPDMTVPPVVWTANLLRTAGAGVSGTAWSWLADLSGQRLFYPPDVSGWDDTRWLDTSTLRGRWLTARYALQKAAINPWATPGYDATEDAATAVTKAMAAVGNPALSSATRAVLADFAATCIPAVTPSWAKGPYRGMRQNALRMLIATAPDAHVS